VEISNCENLTNIKLRKSDYLYLGENLNSLESIDVDIANTFEISDEIYENLNSLSIETVKKLICNFNSFPNLNRLYLSYVKVPNNIFIDSKITKYISISDCKTDIIEILGGGHIDRIKLLDNDYRILKVLEPITFSKLYLYNVEKENQYMPYIPLSMDNNDSDSDNDNDNDNDSDNDSNYSEETTSYETMKLIQHGVKLIQFDTNTLYDYRYKKFIEDNISEIFLTDSGCIPYDRFHNPDRSVCSITLDEIKFTIQSTKKSAKK